MPVEINKLTVSARVQEQRKEWECPTNAQQDENEARRTRNRAQTRQATEAATEIIKRQNER